MKRLIRALLSILFFTMEILGWFFVYALAVFLLTDGAMCGRRGAIGMFAAAVLSAFALFLAVLKWGWSLCAILWAT